MLDTERAADRMPAIAADRVGSRAMSYGNRLRRLEEQMPNDVTPCLMVALVDPQRGTVAALDVQTNKWLRRGDDETSEQFNRRLGAR